MWLLINYEHLYFAGAFNIFKCTLQWLVSNIHTEFYHTHTDSTSAPKTTASLFIFWLELAPWMYVLQACFPEAKLNPDST